jgi:hypothetical protein
MLPVLLEVFIIIIAILVVISVLLLRPELMHLLGACSKLIWTAVSSHGHYKS